MPNNTTRILIYSIGFILVQMALASHAKPIEEPTVFMFDVFLNKKPIGTHSVTINKQGTSITIAVQAQFKVRYLGITFYRYTHSAKKEWRQGCLYRLSSQTNDNGEKWNVQAVQKHNAMQLTINSASKTLSGCVRDFAYWNPALLQSSAFLLNAQDGEYKAVHVEQVAKSPLYFLDKQYGVKKVQIKMDDMPDIALWYSKENIWTALQTQVKKGKVLTYIRRD